MRENADFMFIVDFLFNWTKLLARNIKIVQTSRMVEAPGKA